MILTREKAILLRRMIVRASANLADADALTVPELFRQWKPDADYSRNDRVFYEGQLYRLIPESHHSQSDWTPDLIPAVWQQVDDPNLEYPAWRQPLGAQDAYPNNARVSHKDKRWINVYGDGNVWEPGVYGWAEL